MVFAGCFHHTRASCFLPLARRIFPNLARVATTFIKPYYGLPLAA